MANYGEEITDILTEEGIKKLKVGDVLMFRKYDEQAKAEGRIDLRITRIKKKEGRVWAIQVLTFESDEIAVTGKKNLWGRSKRKTIKEHINEEVK